MNYRRARSGCLSGIGGCWPLSFYFQHFLLSSLYSKYHMICIKIKKLKWKCNLCQGFQLEALIVCLSFIIINLYLAFLVIIIRYVVDVFPDLQIANLQDKIIIKQRLILGGKFCNKMSTRWVPITKENKHFQVYFKCHKNNLWI